MIIIEHENTAKATGREHASDAPVHGAIGHLSSDEELQQAVCAALLRTPGLDASEVFVAVLGHDQVTLSGRVASNHERSLALRVAREHSGGRVVHAELDVDPCKLHR